MYCMSKLVDCFLSRLDVIRAFLFRIGGSMETERLINSVSVCVEGILSATTQYNQDFTTSVVK